MEDPRLSGGGRGSWQGGRLISFRKGTAGSGCGALAGRAGVSGSEGVTRGMQTRALMTVWISRLQGRGLGEISSRYGEVQSQGNPDLRGRARRRHEAAGSPPGRRLKDCRFILPAGLAVQGGRRGVDSG
ncbi:hypothetical protein WJX73_000034 [Symbiochloris irregularis]|uniref:Uncharacterized protein n=1 Tax=Symbiochloris irregularis TaxID=706552 RepID=A0AAW1NMV4_9CHLO